jgi:hypothetical protein
MRKSIQNVDKKFRNLYGKFSKEIRVLEKNGNLRNEKLKNILKNASNSGMVL